MHQPRFFIEYDQTDEGLQHQKVVLDILLKQLGSMQKVATVFRRSAEILTQRESYFLSGKKSKFIDISNVLKAIPIHWVATEIVSWFFLSFFVELSISLLLGRHSVKDERKPRWHLD